MFCTAVIVTLTIAVTTQRCTCCSNSIRCINASANNMPAKRPGISGSLLDVGCISRSPGVQANIPSFRLKSPTASPPVFETAIRRLCDEKFPTPLVFRCQDPRQLDRGEKRAELLINLPKIKTSWQVCNNVINNNNTKNNIKYFT